MDNFKILNAAWSSVKTGLDVRLSQLEQKNFLSTIGPFFRPVKEGSGSPLHMSLVPKNKGETNILQLAQTLWGFPMECYATH